MSSAAVGDSIIAWTRADISAIGRIRGNMASSYARIAASGSAGSAARPAASSAASSMAWLAPSPTGGMRCAASPIRVTPGRAGPARTDGHGFDPARRRRVVGGLDERGQAGVPAVEQVEQGPLVAVASSGRSSARREIPTRRLPSPRRCAARIRFTPTHHRFPGPTSSARSRVAPVGVADGQLDERRHCGQCRVGQQRPDDRAGAVRADEEVAAGPVAVVERQVAAAAGSRGRRGRAGAARRPCRRAASRAGGRAGRCGRSRGVRRTSRVAARGAPGSVRPGRGCDVPRPRGAPADRNRPARPASARACCPDSGCRSSMPPCGARGSARPRVRTPPRRCRAGAGSGPASARRGRHRRSRCAFRPPYRTTVRMDTPYGNESSARLGTPRAAAAGGAGAVEPREDRRYGDPAGRRARPRRAVGPQDRQGARRRPDAALRLRDATGPNCSI